MDYIALSILEDFGFKVWNMAGKDFKRERQRLMFFLTGQNLPQSECGVNTLHRALRVALNPSPGCLARVDDEMQTKMKALIAEMRVSLGASA